MNRYTHPWYSILPYPKFWKFETVYNILSCKINADFLIDWNMHLIDCVKVIICACTGTVQTNRVIDLIYQVWF